MESAVLDVVKEDLTKKVIIIIIIFGQLNQV